MRVAEPRQKLQQQHQMKQQHRRQRQNERMLSNSFASRGGVCGGEGASYMRHTERRTSSIKLSGFRIPSLTTQQEAQHTPDNDVITSDVSQRVLCCHRVVVHHVFLG